MKCLFGLLFHNLIHITVVRTMCESLMNSVGGLDSTSAPRAQSLHVNWQLEDTGHSRYNGARYSHESPIKLEDMVPSDQTEMENVGTASIGHGDQYVERSTQQLPSTEILRLFHESFPHICLSEDILSRSASSLGSSSGSSIEVPDMVWGDCPGATTREAVFDRNGHEQHDVPGPVEYSTHPGIRVSCSRTMEDGVYWDDLAEEQHDQYEVKAKSSVMWRYACAPAA